MMQRTQTKENFSDPPGKITDIMAPRRPSNAKTVKNGCSCNIVILVVLILVVLMAIYWWFQW